LHSRAGYLSGKGSTVSVLPTLNSLNEELYFGSMTL
jgi:hypothetical protein